MPSRATATPRRDTLFPNMDPLAIRTAAGLEIAADLIELKSLPLYQQIAEKVQHLRDLGMSKQAIAQALDVDVKTVARAERWSCGQ